jgi:transcriptional regulator with XRE-family HTH domain
LIRERRLAHGMSLSQFATHVGHTQAEARTWERGEAEPDVEARSALMDVLELDSEVLDAVWPEAAPEGLEADMAATPSNGDPSGDFDDTFLAVGGVVAGITVGEPTGSTTLETAEATGPDVLAEEPTEAIGAPFVIAAPVPTETAMLTLIEPETPRRWNPIQSIYDPDKPWLTYLRTILTVVVLVVLALVLFRLLGQLFDALAELLDTVQTSDDSESTVETLALLFLH